MKLPVYDIVGVNVDDMTTRTHDICTSYTDRYSTVLVGSFGG